MPQQALSQRAGDVDLAGVVILFAGSHQHKDFVVAKFHIAHNNCSAKHHFVGEFLLPLNNHSPSEPVS